MIQNSSSNTGFSAKVENIKTSEEFIVSTAINPLGIYETMVIQASDMEDYIMNPVTIKPLFVVNSSTLRQAEQTHIRTVERFEQLNPKDLIRKYKIEGAVGAQLILTNEFPLGKSAKNNEDDRGSNGKIYTITDYIDELRQNEPEQEEIIQKIWTRFKGKPSNAKEILKEKATILAQVILLKVRLHTKGFLDLRNVNKNSSGDTKQNFISLGELFIEIASVYLGIIDRLAFSILNKGEREIFIDTLQEEFIVIALLENYREDTASMKETFISDLNKKLAAYAPFSFYPDKGESSKNNLLSEFANNVGKIVGTERNLLFNDIIMHTVLRDISILQLDKLLFKEK